MGSSTNAIPVSFSSPLADALEAASLAMGSLDVLVSKTPLRQAWLQRSLLREAVRQTRLSGHEINEIDVAAALAGVRGSARRDGGGITEAINRLTMLSRQQLAVEEDDARALRTAMSGRLLDESNDMEDREAKIRDGALRPPPPLSCSAEGSKVMAAAAASLDLDFDQAMALPITLRRFGVTTTVLPILTGVGGRGSILATLHDLRAEARNGIASYQTLRETWRSWQRALGPRRSTSTLPYLVDYALAASFLSSHQVAFRFGLTMQGARYLLSKMVDLGMLISLPGRGHLDLYLTADVAPPPAGEDGQGDRHTAVLRGHDAEFVRLSEEDLVPIETDLGDLLRDLDVVNDRIKGVLDRMSGKS